MRRDHQSEARREHRLEPDPGLGDRRDLLAREQRALRRGEVQIQAGDAQELVRHQLPRAEAVRDRHVGIDHTPGRDGVQSFDPLVNGGGHHEGSPHPVGPAPLDVPCCYRQ